MTPVAPSASVSTCTSCGRPMRRPRQASELATLLAPVDTRLMSGVELYRHYHRTAPVEDLRFFLRHARLSPALRAAGCRDTGGTLTRPDWYRSLTALQDRWRRETADARQQDISALMAEAV
jgi:hypothetical protein